MLCITGASAAVCLSSTPFAGPVAGARLGRVDGQFVINPTRQELERSELNIVFAASRDAVVMVEGEAQFAPETLIIEALEWGAQGHSAFARRPGGTGASGGQGEESLYAQGR